MPPKPIKMTLADSLESLSKEDFEKFCFSLLSRREEPRVRRNRVEDKSRLQVADVLVSTFTEAGALRETVAILREIGCREEADELVKATSGQSSKPGPSDNEDFVEKHRNKLIQKVTNIACILDELLQRKVIQQESYDTIRAQPTPQEKMRELYTHLTTRACKDILYEVLKEKEPFLVADLS